MAKKEPDVSSFYSPFIYSSPISFFFVGIEVGNNIAALFSQCLNTTASWTYRHYGAESGTVRGAGTGIVERAQTVPRLNRSESKSGRAKKKRNSFGISRAGGRQRGITFPALYESYVRRRDSKHEIAFRTNLLGARSLRWPDSPAVK